METTQGLVGLGVTAELAARIGDKRVSGIAATGNSSQANAYAIRGSANIFSTVTTGSADSARLPTKAAYPNDDIYIINQGAGTLQVYPHVGGQINAVAVNGALAITTGGAAHFKRMSNTVWVAV